MGNRLKERLTITLDKDILHAVDKTIDGENIRNRSHAIASILSHYLTGKVQRAIILAGGKGRRLQGLTNTMPKALLPLGDKPLLQHIIEQIRNAGISDICIVIGYKGEMIREYFGDGQRFGVHLTYAEQHGLGTGSALASARDNLDAPFLLFYGDILTNIDLKKFLSFHSTHRGLGSVALAATQHLSDFGVVGLDGTLIRSFREKPQHDAAGLVSAGMFIFNETIRDHLKSLPEDASLEEDVLKNLVQEKQLHGYPFEARWIDISTPDTYKQAQHIFAAKDAVAAA